MIYFCNADLRGVDMNDDRGRYALLATQKKGMVVPSGVAKARHLRGRECHELRIRIWNKWTL